MTSPIAQAIATVRRRPMLAVAGAGVLGVIAYASSRGSAGAELEQPPEGAPAAGVRGVGVQGYALPGTYAPGDLATADLANAIREGNALTINQLAQLGNALAPNPAQQREAVTGAVQPILDVLNGISSKLPTPSAGPAQPPATPVTVPAAPPPPPAAAPSRISLAQAHAILASERAPLSWATSGAWIRSPAAAYVWASESAFRAWVQRTKRSKGMR